MAAFVLLGGGLALAQSPPAKPPAAPAATGSSPAAPAAATRPAPRKLTLAELIDLAQQRSKLVGIARAHVEMRQTQRREAIYNWFPTGSMSYLITGAPAIQCRGPGNDANPATRTRDCVNTVDPDTGQNISVTSSGIKGVGMQGTLTLVQPLYTFGKIESAVAAADHGIAAGRAQVDMARAEAIVDVERAYWGLKGARAANAALDGVRAELIPWVEKIQKNLDSDRPHYTISDLQRLKSGLGEVDMGQAQLRQGIAVALAGLAALTGEAVDVDDAELDLTLAELAPLAQYEESVLEKRPELRALAEGQAALQSLVKLHRANMLPDVGVVINVILRYSSSIEDSDSAFIDHATTGRFGVFLGLQQPLDLFQRWARMKRAQAEAAQLGATREAAATGILFELRSAHAAAEEARNRLAAAERGEKASRGWLTAVKSALDFGTAEPRDLADSAKNYIIWRLQHFQSITDYNVAMARLRRGAGLY